MKEEKIFKKKIHAIKNPHERCKFLVNQFIEVTSKQNDKKKLKIIRKSLASLAGANCPEAYLYLGKLYYLPNNNNDKAYNSFKNAIKKGYHLAYYEFGYMVEKGLGCKKSKSKAVGYCKYLIEYYKLFFFFFFFFFFFLSFKNLIIIE